MTSNNGVRFIIILIIVVPWTFYLTKYLTFYNAQTCNVDNNNYQEKVDIFHLKPTNMSQKLRSENSENLCKVRISLNTNFTRFSL